MKKFQTKSIKLRLNKTTVSNLSAENMKQLIGGGGTNNAANAAGTLTTVGNSCGCSTAEMCVFTKIGC
jgi:natural product precursor